MSIESDLRKDGIEVIAPISTLTVNKIARSVSEKIAKAFPGINFTCQDLFMELSRLSMYTASIPQGLAEANYFYKNSSVYFREGIDLETLSPLAVHELIHHLQALRDKKGELIRLGLCEFSEFKIYGMGLNEGAVQLMTSICLEEPNDIVKYYDLSFPTQSQTYYPLLCNLVAQMAYITGKEDLYSSTFFSNDNFKNHFVSLCGEKAYYKISHNLDVILTLEEKIIQTQNRLLTEISGKKTTKLAEKIEELKQKLKNTFLETQNLIFTSYFEQEFERIHTTEDIEAYRAKLYNYKNYIAIADGYRTFHDYYINQMANLDLKYESILNNTALVIAKPNKLQQIFQAIQNLWKKDNARAGDRIE